MTAGDGAGTRKGSMEKNEIRAVEIRAELRQLKTMADGSVNVTINLPEDCREQAKVMLDWLGYELRLLVEKT